MFKPKAIFFNKKPVGSEGWKLLNKQYATIERLAKDFNQ